MGSAPSQSNESKFNQHTTSDEIMEAFGEHANNKYVIVTGSNSGLGFETALSLAKYGSKVTIACRSKKNGDEAVEKIKKEVPDAEVSFMQLDLGSLASVRAFVREYKATKQPLHLLINNAGIMACPKALTTDGLESQFGVNHIGHFLLTTGLLDVLKSTGTPQCPARVVTLSSLANWLFAPPNIGIRFDDLNGDTYYHSAERYGSAKLANIMFSNELDRRMKAEGASVIAVALHPGAIKETNIDRHMDFSTTAGMFAKLWHRKGGLYTAVFGITPKTIKQGSSTTLLCALDPAISRGAYYADCKIETVFVHETANDEAKEKQLWEVSEAIVNSKK